MTNKKRILISDDDEIIRMLLVDSLENEDWIMEEAVDGKEALEMLTNQYYDLAIMDYMMPYFTGIDVMDRLPIHVKKELFVIMLTAKSQKEDKELATAAGVTHFVQKPFSPAALYELILTIFEK